MGSSSDQEELVASIELTGEALKAVDLLCRKAHKHKGAPFWVSMDHEGTVTIQVALKDDIQAWCRCMLAARATPRTPVRIRLSLADVREALLSETKKFPKDLISISQSRDGHVDINGWRVGTSRDILEEARKVFEPTEEFLEVAIDPHDVPYESDGYTRITDYQEILRYCSMFATGPTEPARYAMRFVWLDLETAMGLNTSRAGVFRRSKASTKGGYGASCGAPSYPVPIHRDVFLAEKKAKEALLMTSPTHGAIRFNGIGDDEVSSTVSYGYSWEQPEGDFSAEWGIISGKLKKARESIEDGSAVVFTASVKALKDVITDALKDAKKDGKELFVRFMGSECALVYLAANGVATVVETVSLDVSGGPKYGLYFQAAYVADLVGALSTEYADFSYRRAAGGGGATQPLYVSEGKHFEHVLMPYDPR